MKTTTTQIDAKHGAQFGRNSFLYCEPRAKLYVRRVRINKGGYDRGGAYWGIGKPIYECLDGIGFVYYVRCNTRNEAKASVSRMHPSCKFWR